MKNKLSKSDLKFIEKYLTINMPRYKEMCRRTLPSIHPVIGEITEDFKNLYKDDALYDALNISTNLILNSLLRRRSY